MDRAANAAAPPNQPTACPHRAGALARTTTPSLRRLGWAKLGGARADCGVADREEEGAVGGSVEGCLRLGFGL